jgi:hypothetical protein
MRYGVSLHHPTVPFHGFKRSLQRNTRDPTATIFSIYDKNK